MKGVKILRSCLFFSTCLLLCLGLFSTVFGGDQPEGRKLFVAKGCNYCHSVPDSRIEATTSIEPLKSDLIDLRQRFRKTWLENYLRKKAELKGEFHRKAFKGSDQELREIIVWLYEQENSKHEVSSNAYTTENHTSR